VVFVTQRPMYPLGKAPRFMVGKGWIDPRTDMVSLGKRKMWPTYLPIGNLSPILCRPSSSCCTTVTEFSHSLMK